MEKVAIKGSGGAGGETFNVVTGLSNMVMSSPGDTNGRQNLWVGGVQQENIYNLIGGQLLDSGSSPSFSNWEQASQGLLRLYIQSDSIYFWVGRINADGGNSMYGVIQIIDSTGVPRESQSVLFNQDSVYTMVFENGSIEINQPLSLIIKGDPLEDYTNAYVSINGWSFGLEG